MTTSHRITPLFFLVGRRGRAEELGERHKILRNHVTQPVKQFLASNCLTDFFSLFLAFSFKNFCLRQKFCLSVSQTIKKKEK